MASKIATSGILDVASQPSLSSSLNHSTQESVRINCFLIHAASKIRFEEKSAQCRLYMKVCVSNYLKYTNGLKCKTVMC